MTNKTLADLIEDLAEAKTNKTLADLIEDLAEAKTNKDLEPKLEYSEQELVDLMKSLTKKQKDKKEKDYQLVNGYFKVLNYSPKYKKYLIQINENYTAWIGKNYIRPQIVQITLDKNADLYLYDNKGQKVVLDLKKVNLDKLKDLK